MITICGKTLDFFLRFMLVSFHDGLMCLEIRGLVLTLEML
jgi:hypothetical protein